MIAATSAEYSQQSHDYQSWLQSIWVIQGKMIQNLWWATGYNFVAIPLAAGAVFTLGFVMPPSVGAALMSLSTVVVALNAQLLRRAERGP